MWIQKSERQRPTFNNQKHQYKYKKSQYAIEWKMNFRRETVSSTRDEQRWWGTYLFSVKTKLAQMNSQSYKILPWFRVQNLAKYVWCYRIKCAEEQAIIHLARSSTYCTVVLTFKEFIGSDKKKNLVMMIDLCINVVITCILGSKNMEPFSPWRRKLPFWVWRVLQECSRGGLPVDDSEMQGGLD